MENKNGLTDSQKEKLADFTKLISKVSKTREMPLNMRYGFTTHSYFSKDYTIDDINDAKNNLNIPTMRAISNFYYKTSSSYRRILNFFSYLFKYYYTLDLKGLARNYKKGKNEVIKKIYFDTLDFLDNLNIEDTFGFIASRMLVDGAFFGYLTFFQDNKVTITMLDPNYCISRYKSAYGTNLVEFDVRFFEKYADLKERDRAIANFPPIVKTVWNKYKSGTMPVNWEPYAMLPAETSCAFLFGGISVPPFFDTIIDIINFNDYKEIEKRRDTQELEKLLVQHLALDENGDLDALLEEMAAMHEAVSSIFKDNPYVDVLTSVADIDLKNTQSNVGAATRNNIEKMMIPKYENAGLSFELFSSTTATSLELSISNSTSFMSQVISSFSAWLSMLCLSHFNYKKLEPIVTILPLTWYNEKRLIDTYLKQAQSGYSLILPYVATGKKQSTLVDTKTLENDLLELDTLLIPPQTSYTQSGNGSSSAQSPNIKVDGPGRPEKPLDEKSEKTIKNINAGG